MLSTFNFDDRHIQLLPFDLKSSSDNLYSILVGNNGTGKSRLLSAIARDTIKSSKSRAQYDRWMSESAPKIIAVSTSPFDSFPLPQPMSPSSAARMVANRTYSYIGTRGPVFSSGSAMALISSAAKSLLAKMASNRFDDRFGRVVDRLGFSPLVELAFKGDWSRISESKEINPIEWDRQGIRSFATQMMEDGLYTERDLSEAIGLANELSKIADSNANFGLRIDMADKSFFSTEIGYMRNEVGRLLNCLLDYRVIRLLDMKLNKYDHGPLSMRRASSGEQCIVLSLLGISANIQDGSLILIDEPEISLHPAWQEQYMGLLDQAVSNYSGCHFIVATHSPQIVANSPVDRSYVVSLSTGHFHAVADLSEKSADYQLAEVFHSPGFQNEYLNRMAVNLLAKVAKRRRFSHEDFMTFDRIKRLAADSRGPIVDIIESIGLMRAEYGVDK